jgi:1-acyl-sn-glycerol-3-phosphate acyltransferase
MAKNFSAKKNYSKVEPDKYTIWQELGHYFIIFCILYPYFKIFHRITIEGRENIPKGKSILVASNHISNYDPVIVSLAVLRPVAYMTKRELFSVPVISQLIRFLGAFSVNRKKLEVSTIKSAKAVLKTKWLLGIFPEGTRIKTGKIGLIQKGFGYLAKATGAEILPLGIFGANKAFGKITVRIGKPIPVPKSPEEAITKWGKAIEKLTGIEYDESIQLS